MTYVGSSVPEKGSRKPNLPLILVGRLRARAGRGGSGSLRVCSKGFTHTISQLSRASINRVRLSSGLRTVGKAHSFM